MTDDELELAILRKYIEQHKKAALADPERQNKCLRELDMREVIAEISVDSGPSLEYTANLWLDRLAPPIHGVSKGPLRRCSNSKLNH